MIKAKDLYFSYDKDKSFITKLNVEIEKGKITTILGPNGSGKSTLLSIFAGLNKPTSGDVSIKGNSIKSLKQKDLAKEIATVHQQNTVPSDITVKELVSYGRIPHKKYFQGNNESDDEIIEWAIKRTGLQSLKDKAVMSMSGGERQRAFIAMVIAQGTEYIFLDEPLNNLDMNNSVQMMKVLKKLCDELGKTIILVMHDINFTSCYSDYIICLKNGMIAKEGIVDEIINKETLEDIYEMDFDVKDIDGKKISIYY